MLSTSILRITSSQQILIVNDYHKSNPQCQKTETEKKKTASDFGKTTEAPKHCVMKFALDVVRGSERIITWRDWDRVCLVFSEVAGPKSVRCTSQVKLNSGDPV